MVNSVSFGTRMGIYDKPNLDAPQAYQRPQAAPAQEAPAPKKSHKALKWIAGLVATAAVVAGGLALGKHFDVFNASKIAAKLPDAVKNNETLIKYAKEPVKNIISGLDVAGKFVLDKGTTAWRAVKGLFSRAEAAAPAEA